MNNKFESGQYLDLMVILILAVLMIPLVALTSGVVRIVPGMIFVLFIPGYSLISALFQGNTSINNLERCLLSIAASVAIVSLSGLALSYTPWGLKLWTVIIFLFIFVVIASGVAWFRRRRIADYEGFSPSIEFRSFLLSVFPAAKNRKYKIISFSFVIVAVVMALTSLVAMNSSSLNTKTNEFYLLSKEGNTQNYPRLVHIGESVTINTVIVNSQYQAIDYLVKIIEDGVETAKFEPIHLLKNEKWQDAISFTPEKIGNNQKVEYQLFEEGSDQPEGVLYIYIDVVK